MGVQPDRGCAPLGGSLGMGAISMTGIPVGVGASELVVNELATDGERARGSRRAPPLHAVFLLRRGSAAWHACQQKWRANWRPAWWHKRGVKPAHPLGPPLLPPSDCVLTAEQLLQKQVEAAQMPLMAAAVRAPPLLANN